VSSAVELSDLLFPLRGKIETSLGLFSTAFFTLKDEEKIRIACFSRSLC